MSLFWLVVIVGVHAFIEYISLRHKNIENIIFELFWHIKLDLAFISFALVLSLYMEVIFGLIIAKFGSRFASFLAYQNIFRTILMSLDDITKSTKAIIILKNKKQTSLKVEHERENKITIFDYLSLGLLLSSILGILLSPYILNLQIVEVIEKFSIELAPFSKIVAQE